MDKINKISLLGALVGLYGYTYLHKPFFILVSAVSAAAVFLADMKKEESRTFLDLFMVGLIIPITIKVLFF